MESRTDLLNWLNSTFDLSYTKIEQMGTGSAYCQIMDAIYGDVPLAKVKFNANQQYMYVNNFKILQAAFDRHKIDKQIPVERLVQCRFQDNLEFFKWMKKLFDKSDKGNTTKTNNTLQTPAIRTNHAAVSKSGITTHVPPVISMNENRMGHMINQPLDTPKVEELTCQISELKTLVEGLEKERNFYFGKLRDIEILCLKDDIDDIMFRRQIQNILYSTEEGFEIPNDDTATAVPLEEDDETF
jgi:RP/EB family microtubule-associated protein